MFHMVIVLGISQFEYIHSMILIDLECLTYGRHSLCAEYIIFEFEIFDECVHL